jgi:hypothetical protein
MSDLLTARRGMPRWVPAALTVTGWLLWQAWRRRHTAVGAPPARPHDNRADQRALARETGRMADA